MTQGKHHHELAIINASIDEYDAYATKDLFFPHPTRPGLWKILGRSDDQIMLTTGETVGFSLYVVYRRRKIFLMPLAL